jgi:hypothetical protein
VRWLLVCVVMISSFGGVRLASGSITLSVPSPVTALNSSQSDELGSITGDGLTIVLASRRNSSENQIFAASRESLTGPWGTPSGSDFLGIGADATHGTGSPVVSSDGLTLFFAHQVSSGPYGIFVSTRPNASSTFGVGTLVSELQVGAAVRPSWLSSDGLRLYFHALENGLWQLYVAERSTVSSSFGAPSKAIFSNLAAFGASDAEASLTPDELQIFFTSDRAGGLGGDDIWWAGRPDTSSPFGAPVDLTSINSPYSDRMPVINGDTLLFSSDRNGSGGLDIYSATAVPEPASIVLWTGLSAMGLVMAWRRRKRAA